MNDLIKQRLLGLLVVFILILAFISVILEEPVTFLKAGPMSIPKSPDMPAPSSLFDDLTRVEQKLRISIEQERSATSLAMAESAEETVQVTLPEGVSILKHVDKPIRFKQIWTVNLQTSTDQALLQAQKSQLIEQGFRAYVRPITPASLEYGLFVGPEISRQRAEASLQKLQNLFPDQQPGLVVYLPE